MMPRVLEKVGCHRCCRCSNAGNGAHRGSGRCASARLGVKTYADRLNTLWEIDSGRVGPQSQCNNSNL
jgi:hypothetical protein